MATGRKGGLPLGVQTHLPGRARRRSVESAIVMLVLVAFTRLHAVVARDLAAATAHAHRVQSLERGLHLDVELTTNRWLALHDEFIAPAVLLYRLSYVVLLGVLVWVFFRQPDVYLRGPADLRGDDRPCPAGVLGAAGLPAAVRLAGCRRHRRRARHPGRPCRSRWQCRCEPHGDAQPARGLVRLVHICCVECWSGAQPTARIARVAVSPNGNRAGSACFTAGSLPQPGRVARLGHLPERRRRRMGTPPRSVLRGGSRCHA